MRIQDTLKKDQRINIRLSANDLESLKANAVELGLPRHSMSCSNDERYQIKACLQLHMNQISIAKLLNRSPATISSCNYLSRD